jgi:hypothetical protein
MKNSQIKIAAFIVLFHLAFINVGAQQITNEDTYLINQYFQVNVNQQAEAKLVSPKTNPHMGSYVGIVQTGIDNNININSLQTGDEQIVSQSGKKNNYEYYNYYSNENSSMQVNQVGNLNSVQVFGENSLMKDAKISQKGSFKTLIIKNY